ncbi:hypothetical protein GJ496_001559 [Pomphorhynchus laevis]|nr:hypothetical protein GJ496_001559 [Pomphorhynchus laevis]
MTVHKSISCLYTQNRLYTQNFHILSSVLYLNYCLYVYNCTDSNIISENNKKWNTQKENVGNILRMFGIWIHAIFSQLNTTNVPDMSRHFIERKPTPIKTKEAFTDETSGRVHEDHVLLQSKTRRIFIPRQSG